MMVLDRGAEKEVQGKRVLAAGTRDAVYCKCKWTVRAPASEKPNRNRKRILEGKM